MMSKIRVFAVMLFCVALVPTLAAAGSGSPTGSCYWESAPTGPLSFPSDADGFAAELAQCVDDLTEDDCEYLTKGGFTWQEGVACTERNSGFDWDGSCLIPDFDMFGDICVLLWIDPSEKFTSEELCLGEPAEPAGGSGYTWFNDTVCGGAPVPAASRGAMALMVLVLLAGSLTFLSLKGSSS